jgi:hypothetical protein
VADDLTRLSNEELTRFLDENLTGLSDEELTKIADEQFRRMKGKVYITPIGNCNPRGYNQEMHHDYGDRPCPNCGRPYSAHTPDEFCDCEEKNPRTKS